ncbi:hypothetical protein SAFG77S_08293 [Streptomyces afghaniensis]
MPSRSSGPTGEQFSAPLVNLDEAGAAGALAAAEGGPAVAEPPGGGEHVLAVEDFELDAGGSDRDPVGHLLIHWSSVWLKWRMRLSW